MEVPSMLYLKMELSFILPEKIPALENLPG